MARGRRAGCDGDHSLLERKRQHDLAAAAGREA